MGRTPPPTGTLQTALDGWVDCGKNYAELARITGKPRTTVQEWVRVAMATGLMPRSGPVSSDPKDVTIANLRVELERVKAERISKPHFTVRQDYTGSSEKIRIVCIGDAHDSPAIPDKSRFEWIGAYVRATKPDVVLQIGDFATLDSLNTHTPNETFAGKSKPTYMADMASFNEALAAMQLDGVERHCTLGNHERRLYVFEDNAPEAYGMMQCELQKVFEHHGWTFSPYGQITYYGGVGFVHAALNRMGKTFGGKNAESTIANDSIHDLVIGHSHVDRRHKAPKIGGNNFVQVVNVGCALPDQHIEEYAQHALTGWSYGIADMTIQRNHIQDYAFVSMSALEERYGKKTQVQTPSTQEAPHAA